MEEACILTVVDELFLCRVSRVVAIRCGVAAHISVAVACGIAIDCFPKTVVLRSERGGIVVSSIDIRWQHLVV